MNRIETMKENNDDNDSSQWNGRCYIRPRPKIDRPSPPPPPRRKSVDHAQRYTRTTSFHEATPSNSYRRGRCNVESFGVSFGGRTTSFHGVQKGAEGRRSTVAPCRGGSTAPTHAHTHIYTSYSWLEGTRGRSLRRNTTTTTKGRRTPTRRHGY